MARILIEARTLQLGGGPAVYARELLRALARQETAHRFSVLVPRAADCVLPELPGWEVIEAGWCWRGWQPLWDEVVAARTARRGHFALLHMTKNAAPPAWGGPTVTTLHDVCPLVLPELSAPLEGRYWAWQMRHLPARAAQLLTVSGTEQARIARVLGVDRERLTVTRLGVDAAFGAAPDAAAQAAVRARCGIPATYLLNVGTVSVKKNITVMLDALKRARQQQPDLPPLVIVGRPGHGIPEIWPEGVIRVPQLPHGELVHLYHGAQLMLFPSRFESFGLPAAEALAAGVPLIVSDDSALPEITGDAAVKVPVDDAAALAAAILRLTGDPAECARLRAAGRERARLFDWDTCAQQTLAVYDAVLAR